MTEDQLKIELARAYRCIQGLHNALETGNTGHLGYHQPTIAAAKRFVFLGDMAGSGFFMGQPVEVMHEALRLPQGLSGDEG